MFETYLSKINKLMTWINGLLMVIMMLLLLVDCGSRIVDMPVAGMSELSVFMLIIVTYLGLAGGEEFGQHVRVEALLTRLPQKTRCVVEWVVSVVELLTLAVFFVSVWLGALKSFRTGQVVTGSAQLLLWPVKWTMVVGLALYFLQVAIKTRRNFKSLTNAFK